MKYTHLGAENLQTKLDYEDLAKGTPVALKFFADERLKTTKNKVERKFNLVGIFLGNVGIVSLPYEPFVEVGLQIREKIFPDKTMLIATDAGIGGNHQFGGYIPNKFNYGRGGYETQPRSTPFAPDTADKLIDDIRKMRNEVQ